MCDTSNAPKWNEKKRTTTRDFLIIRQCKGTNFFSIMQEKK